MKSLAGAGRRDGSVSPSSFQQSTPERKRQRFRRGQRLAKKADIEAVRRRGKKSQTAHLEIRELAGGSQRARIGLIVPRHKHTAVERNRLRRRLRELIRTEILPLMSAGDTLLRVKADAYDASFADWRAEFDSLAKLVTRTGV